MGILVVYQSLTSSTWITVYPNFVLLYFSISSPLIIILTLTIVIRLVLHARNIHADMGVPAGISRSYEVTADILIESSALHAVSSLLVLGLWLAASNAVEIFLPILAETQVRAFP